jgi:hypothetical protein
MDVNTRVFLVLTPCSSERSRRFRGTYHLHLQSKRVSKLSLTPDSIGFLRDLRLTLKMEAVCSSETLGSKLRGITTQKTVLLISYNAF